MLKTRQQDKDRKKRRVAKTRRVSDESSSYESDRLQRQKIKQKQSGSSTTSNSSSSRFVNLSSLQNDSSSQDWGGFSLGQPKIVTGPKKKKIQPRSSGTNQQPINPRKMGKKGAKKSAQHKKDEVIIKQVIEETKYRSFEEEIRDLIAAQELAKRVSNEFPNLQAIRVTCDVDLTVLAKAASIYSFYAMSRRAYSPADVVSVGINQDVGLLWLAWYAITYDLYFNGTANRKSMFSNAHPHYRRFFNSLKFNTTNGYYYTWSAPDPQAFANYWTNKGGPVSPAGLSWETGFISSSTGRMTLVNSFPTLALTTLENEGASAAARIFQACLQEDYKLSPMESIPKYQQNFPPAAFAIFVPDQNPDFPFSGEIRCEVEIPDHARDIAELALVANNDPYRTCPFKEGVISGFSALLYKLAEPDQLKSGIRMLPKEIPITSIITAVMAMLVGASKLVRDDLNIHTITMDPENVMSALSSGQVWTAAMLQAAQRYSLGNIAIGLEGLSPSGSTPLLFDARAYVPLTTYNNVIPTGLQECLSEFSVHKAAQNKMAAVARRGVEIYLPYITCRGNFGGNPLMLADGVDFNDFVEVMFPYANVSGWHFMTVGPGQIPNFCNPLEYDEMYFVGDSPTLAINQVNAVFNTISAGLSSTSFTDVDIDTTSMYFTQILEDDNSARDWDRTQYLKMTRVSNRFPLNSQIIGTLPNLTPVFYGGRGTTAAGYLAWYSEYSSLLGDTDTMRDMIIRWFRNFSHQRAAVGSFIANDYYVLRGAQGKGGGFFHGIVGMIRNGIKGVAKVGRVLGGISSLMNDEQTRVLNHVVNHPDDWPQGPYQALHMQQEGAF